MPIDIVSKRAPWSYSLLLTLQHLIPDLHPSVQQTAEHLNKYNLAEDAYRTASSMRREVAAVEQLTVDLALSGHTFSPYPIRRARHDEQGIDDAFETMSIAAGAMSLRAPKPPPVQFGFLRPVLSRDSQHHERDDTVPSNEPCPLGVELLLQDWSIGEDPRSYIYEDPYATSLPSGHAIERKASSAVAAQTVQRAPPAVTKTAPAPPSIAFSQPQALRSNQLPDEAISRSQAMGSQPTTFAIQSSSSQYVSMPSTQVLPGPYGGRPSLPKKKPVKKRMGGF